MSHLLCTVILPKGSKIAEAEEIVERMLQPFHEFECTGTDDEYVQEIDETAELREEYEKRTEKRLRAPDGSLHDPHDDRFYRDPTPAETAKIGLPIGSGVGDGISYQGKDWGDGQGYRQKVRFVPDGFVEVELPTRELRSFAEWVNYWTSREVVSSEAEIDRSDTHKHKYGYTLVDAAGEVVRCVDRTNPNAKWDWWQIGGRWTGEMTKRDPIRNPKNYDKCIHCDGTGSRADFDYSGPQGDWARKGHEGATDVFPVIGTGCNACYGTGMNLQHPSKWKGARGEIMPIAELSDDFSSFAFLTPEGEWIERGEMGWWGVVHDEKDKEAWKASCKTILQKYREHIAVAVDCHI